MVGVEKRKTFSFAQKTPTEMHATQARVSAYGKFDCIFLKQCLTEMSNLCGED